MILKASQRGGSGALARHLLNANDNDHVTVQEVSGFMADDVHGAFREIEAIAKNGTKCNQYMFSLSLNPPMGHEVSSAEYIEVVDRIGKALKLEDQPRVVVFHEKESRIHAHAVWSRIDLQEMKAINLPFFKTRLNEISRDIYLEKGWDLPQGFLDSEKRDPLNYSLPEYQQAKRMEQNPKHVKAVLKACWDKFDHLESFKAALKEHGFFLAKGDRRGFVALNMTGNEVLSLSRWLDVKTRDLKVKLGDPQALPSVADTQSLIEKNLNKKVEQFQADLDQLKQERLLPLLAKRRDIIREQRAERDKLEQTQAARMKQENQSRQSRYRKGIKGLWDRVTGQHKKITLRNEAEYQQNLKRDPYEWDRLRESQLKSRNQIISRIRTTKADLQKQQLSLHRVRNNKNIPNQEKGIEEKRNRSRGFEQ